MEKNNLDKLYQQKLNDYSELPDAKVWSRIEASLDKKKKKRVIPIWWYMGGAAAVLLISILVFNPLSNNGINPALTETETTIPEVNSSSKDAKEIEVTSTELKTEIQEKNSSTGDSITEYPSKFSTSTTNKLTSTNTSSQKAIEKQNSEVVSTIVRKENSDVKQNTLSKEIDDSKDAVAVQENSIDETLSKDTNINAGLNQVTAKENKEEVAANQTTKKSLFEEIEKKQKEDDKEVKVVNADKKWSVGPSVAPVYYNAFGDGSPIHSNFAENSKSGNLNLSYGLSVGYKLNNKLTVRSGVHRVNYGYDTEEISFTATFDPIASAQIENINYNQTARTIVVENNTKRADANASAAEFANTSPAFNGRMVQNVGYVEVPVELNYALLDKKFGINVIGGFSSLFLVDNSISLEADGLSTEMGEANNVNSVNFSSNIGIGLNYQFSKNIQFNLEPIFKYQLSAFADEAGTFNPYAVGIYSGLNFRF